MKAVWTILGPPTAGAAAGGGAAMAIEFAGGWPSGLVLLVLLFRNES